MSLNELIQLKSNSFGGIHSRILLFFWKSKACSLHLSWFRLPSTINVTAKKHLVVTRLNSLKSKTMFVVYFLSLMVACILQMCIINSTLSYVRIEYSLVLQPHANQINVDIFPTEFRTELHSKFISFVCVSFVVGNSYYFRRKLRARSAICWDDTIKTIIFYWRKFKIKNGLILYFVWFRFECNYMNQIDFRCLKNRYMKTYSYTFVACKYFSRSNEFGKFLGKVSSTKKSEFICMRYIYLLFMLDTKMYMSCTVFWFLFLANWNFCHSIWNETGLILTSQFESWIIYYCFYSANVWRNWLCIVSYLISNRKSVHFFSYPNNYYK